MHSHCQAQIKAYTVVIHGRLYTRVETWCPAGFEHTPAWLAALVIFRSLKCCYVLFEEGGAYCVAHVGRYVGIP